MKAPFLLVIIVSLHVVVVGSVLFIQGCGTARQGIPQPPPAPVMPPDSSDSNVKSVRPGPVITPPRPDVNVPRPKAVEIKTYTVKPGDILSRIASKVGVSVREISELNGIDNPNKIRVGQELVLPDYAKTQSLNKAPHGVTSAPKPSAKKTELKPGEVYEVVPGDVLSRIAVRHGTTVNAIMQLNKLASTKILVGQKLRMPAGAQLVKPSADKVEKAKPEPKREESVFDTKELNLDITEEQIAEPTHAQGQKAVEEDTQTAATVEDKSNGSIFSVSDAYTYTVAEGDTVKQIAMDFVVDPDKLRKMNNLSPEDKVKPGQEILIPPAKL